MEYRIILFVTITIIISSVNCYLNPCENAKDGELKPFPRHEFFYMNYLLCKNGQSILMTCDEAQEFDVEKLECKIRQKQIETIVNNSHSENENENKINETINQKVLKYCDNLNDGTMLPYSEKCNEFYLCANQKALLKNCAKGLTFSSSREYCVQNDNPDCSARNLFADICDDKEHGELIPHLDDCGRFIACVLGRSVEKYCPAGLHFSPKLHVCTWPKDAGCEIQDKLCHGLEDGVHLPEPKNCSEFYICLNQKSLVKQCATNLHFSPTALYCMVPEQAGCESNEICKGQENGETFPNPRNCSEYYLCFHDEARPNECPNDLHYSKVEKHCMLPELAGCDPAYNTTTVATTETTTESTTESTTQSTTQSTAEGTTTETTTTEATTIEATTTEATTTEATTTEATTTEATTTNKPTTKPGSCKGQRLGKNIKHPSDCTKYIVCIGGGVVRDCPSPLEFNADLEVCDWPERAGCTV